MTRKDVCWATCSEAISIFTSPAIARSPQRSFRHRKPSNIPLRSWLLHAQGRTYRRSCMIAHDVCAAGAKVYRILVQVGMLRHERVLIVDGNTGGSHLL